MSKKVTRRPIEDVINRIVGSEWTNIPVKEETGTSEPFRVSSAPDVMYGVVVEVLPKAGNLIGTDNDRAVRVVQKKAAWEILTYFDKQRATPIDIVGEDLGAPDMGGNTWANFVADQSEIAGKHADIRPCSNIKVLVHIPKKLIDQVPEYQDIDDLAEMTANAIELVGEFKEAAVRVGKGDLRVLQGEIKPRKRTHTIRGLILKTGLTSKLFGRFDKEMTAESHAAYPWNDFVKRGANLEKFMQELKKLVTVNRLQWKEDDDTQLAFVFNFPVDGPAGELINITYQKKNSKTSPNAGEVRFSKNLRIGWDSFKRTEAYKNAWQYIINLDDIYAQSSNMLGIPGLGGNVECPDGISWTEFSENFVKSDGTTGTVTSPLLNKAQVTWKEERKKFQQWVDDNINKKGPKYWKQLKEEAEQIAEVPKKTYFASKEALKNEMEEASDTIAECAYVPDVVSLYDLIDAPNFESIFDFLKKVDLRGIACRVAAAIAARMATEEIREVVQDLNVADLDNQLGQMEENAFCAIKNLCTKGEFPELPEFPSLSLPDDLPTSDVLRGIDELVLKAIIQILLETLSAMIKALVQKICDFLDPRDELFDYIKEEYPELASDIMDFATKALDDYGLGFVLEEEFGISRDDIKNVMADVLSCITPDEAAQLLEGRANNGTISSVNSTVGQSIFALTGENPFHKNMDQEIELVAERSTDILPGRYNSQRRLFVDLLDRAGAYMDPSDIEKLKQRPRFEIDAGESLKRDANGDVIVCSQEEIRERSIRALVERLGLDPAAATAQVRDRDKATLKNMMDFLQSDFKNLTEDMVPSVSDGNGCERPANAPMVPSNLAAMDFAADIVTDAIIDPVHQAFLADTADLASALSVTEQRKIRGSDPQFNQFLHKTYTDEVEAGTVTKALELKYNETNVDAMVNEEVVLPTLQKNLSKPVDEIVDVVPASGFTKISYNVKFKALEAPEHNRSIAENIQTVVQYMRNDPLVDDPQFNIPRHGSEPQDTIGWLAYIEGKLEQKYRGTNIDVNIGENEVEVRAKSDHVYSIFLETLQKVQRDIAYQNDILIRHVHRDMGISDIARSVTDPDGILQVNRENLLANLSSDEGLYKDKYELKINYPKPLWFTTWPRPRPSAILMDEYIIDDIGDSSVRAFLDNFAEYHLSNDERMRAAMFSTKRQASLRYAFAKSFSHLAGSSEATMEYPDAHDRVLDTIQDELYEEVQKKLIKDLIGPFLDSPLLKVDPNENGGRNLLNFSVAPSRSALMPCIDVMESLLLEQVSKKRIKEDYNNPRCVTDEGEEPHTPMQFAGANTSLEIYVRLHAIRGFISLMPLLGSSLLKRGFAFDSATVVRAIEKIIQRELEHFGGDYSMVAKQALRVVRTKVQHGVEIPEYLQLDPVRFVIKEQVGLIQQKITELINQFLDNPAGHNANADRSFYEDYLRNINQFEVPSTKLERRISDRFLAGREIMVIDRDHAYGGQYNYEDTGESFRMKNLFFWEKYFVIEKQSDAFYEDMMLGDDPLVARTAEHFLAPAAVAAGLIDPDPPVHGIPGEPCEDDELPPLDPMPDGFAHGHWECIDDVWAPVRHRVRPGAGGFGVGEGAGNVGELIAVPDEGDFEVWRPDDAAVDPAARLFDYQSRMVPHHRVNDDLNALKRGIIDDPRLPDDDPRDPFKDTDIPLVGRFGWFKEFRHGWRLMVNLGDRRIADAANDDEGAVDNKERVFSEEITYSQLEDLGMQNGGADGDLVGIAHMNSCLHLYDREFQRPGNDGWRVWGSEEHFSWPIGIFEASVKPEETSIDGVIDDVIDIAESHRIKIIDSLISGNLHPYYADSPGFEVSVSSLNNTNAFFKYIINIEDIVGTLFLYSYMASHFDTDELLLSAKRMSYTMLESMQSIGCQHDDMWYRKEDKSSKKSGGMVGKYATELKNMTVEGAKHLKNVAKQTVPLIVKGLAMQFDPAYQFMSLINATVPDALPFGMTLASLPTILPVNLYGPPPIGIGIGPPVSTVGLAALSLPLLPGEKKKSAEDEPVCAEDAADAELAPEEEQGENIEAAQQELVSIIKDGEVIEVPKSEIC